MGNKQFFGHDNFITFIVRTVSECVNQQVRMKLIFTVVQTNL